MSNDTEVEIKLRTDDLNVLNLAQWQGEKLVTVKIDENTKGY
jgi:hypothetical protein